MSGTIRIVSLEQYIEMFQTTCLSRRICGLKIVNEELAFAKQLQ